MLSKPAFFVSDNRSDSESETFFAEQDVPATADEMVPQILNRKRDGLFMLPPFSTKDNTGVYRGDIDAFHSVMQYVRHSSQKYLILSGSHTIFNTRFNAILKQHEESGADITIMYNEDARFNPEEQNRDLRLLFAEDGIHIRSVVSFVTGSIGNGVVYPVFWTQ